MYMGTHTAYYTLCAPAHNGLITIITITVPVAVITVSAGNAVIQLRWKTCNVLKEIQYLDRPRRGIFLLLINYHISLVQWRCGR